MNNKNNSKINLLILFGGKSAEHEVSIVSARNIANAVNRDKYSILLIGIDRKGRWIFIDENEFTSSEGFSLNEKKLSNFETFPFSDGDNFFVSIDGNKKSIDAVFPVLHGTFGEDGSVQGLLKMFNVPFVGPSILGSSVSMDKDISKRLLRDAGIPVANFQPFKNNERENVDFDKLSDKFGLPFFVKPANLGSSVGISKVVSRDGFDEAIEKAFLFDRKIVIEEFVDGKEIECSVIGNENPISSILGEIIPTSDFYSYEAKYLDGDGAKMFIPANLSKDISDKIRKMAIEVFRVLECEGMGRVDFFLTENNQIFVNEINTIPGFTSTSMYPKLWEESGIAYSDLIDRLIELAMDRFRKESVLKVDN